MNYYLEVLKKYAVFSGRAGRKEYWMFVLFNFIIGFLLALIFYFLKPLRFLLYVYCLAILIPSLAVFVRRLHDTNRSGWWWFFNLVPLIGAITMIVFLAQDSIPGDNKYGPNPKGVAVSQANAGV